MRKHYANRDSCELDEAGGYYMRHVTAMTSEGLHSKGAVAAELGHRDMVIDELLAAASALISLLMHPSLDADETIPEIVDMQAAITKAKGGKA